MNDKSLEKNLANLERELLALQTAHDVGLGAVEFNTYSGEAPARQWMPDWPSSHFIAIMMEVIDGEPLNPIIQASVQGVGMGNSASLGRYVMQHSPSRFSSFDAGVGGSYPQVTTYEYRIDSTSRLSISFAETIEEYEDWIRNA